MDLERYQEAWARNAIPKQQLDDQEKIVVQDEGRSRADQGTLDFDKVQLCYCHIVAPITGRVGLRLVDPGNLVQSSGSTILAVVTQMQPITVVFTMAQDNLSQVLHQMHHGASADRRCLRSRADQEARNRKTARPRQPDRHHHRNRQAARLVR